MQQLYIIKIGGNILENEDSKAQFIEDFALLNVPKLLIHGGGKTATAMATQLGIESKMVNGRRITDRATLDIVTMVYGGLINKSVVSGLQVKGCNAIGLTGADAGCVLAEKRKAGEVDYGFAGDIKEVNAKVFHTFLSNGLTPVIAPLTQNTEGGLLNTNADTMASSIAVALSSYFEVTLLYCFEKKGVLSDPENDDSVIDIINKQKYHLLKEDGTISHGMIPKLDNAFDALSKGVKQVVICNAKSLTSWANTNSNKTSSRLGTILTN